ncbi:MAG TPA: hypothetical protein DDW52_15370 [Planctomycetaceae bacterium]|nr:hypothetical protein [Planctomycetaceae bacterium]
MNSVVLRRRLAYISAIVLLLVPLYFMGRPAIREDDGSVTTQGGVLSQIRDEYDLSQGDLGEIDPASESMRLATLGLRGVAASILWQKAEGYKKEQYWDRMSATLQQIAVLQPHFVNVWDFQSHNLAYNVSHEFDDYRQRYQWVKRGIDYLLRGGKFNKNNTFMPYQTGWIFGNKIGMADEKKQFRELYREDDNFHDEVRTKSGLNLAQADGLGPDRRPDNWLSGVLWYDKAYDMVGQGARPCKSTMMFYRQGPQWMMKYADGLQSEGILDVAAKVAWGRAGSSWGEFGDRRIKTSFGTEMNLRQVDSANERYQILLDEFKEFCGSTYDDLYQASFDSLTEDEQQAWLTKDIDRTFDQVLMAEDVGYRLTIPPDLVARQLPSDKRIEGIKLAKDLKAAKELITHIEIYRNQINYSYWEARCEAEQEDAAVTARTSMYEAEQLLDRGELNAAIEKYEIAWANWEKLFNKHPSMMVDDSADGVLAAIEEYRKTIDGDLPEDFELEKFLEFRELYDSALADPAMMSIIADWPQRYPGRNFLDEMLRKTAVINMMDTPVIELDTMPVDAGPPIPMASSDTESAAPIAETETETEADGNSSSDDSSNDDSSNDETSEAGDGSGVDKAAEVGAADSAAGGDSTESSTAGDEAESPSSEAQPDKPAETSAESSETPAESPEVPAESPEEPAKPAESPTGTSGLPVASPVSGDAPRPGK